MARQGDIDAKQNLVIRVARDGDAERIAAIDASSRPEAWSESQHRSVIRAGLGDAIVLVSEFEDEHRAKSVIVGFLAGRFVVDEGELDAICVEHSFRRQGVAAALLDAFHDSLLKRGVSRVFLEVRQSNAGACSFYEEHGYAAVGKRSGYYSDGEDALCLQRVLE